MMKHIFFVALGCLMCGAVKAQHQQVFAEYLREAGDQAALFVGKMEVEYSPVVYLNFPYLQSDDFVAGDVLFDGLWYRDVLLRYDAYQKQLVANTPVKHLNICVSMNFVDGFRLDGTDYERRDGEMVAILFSSPRMELIEQVDVYVKEEFLTQLSFKYKFFRDVRYYVLRDGKKYEVSKLRSVLKLYPDIKKELKRYAKQCRLDFGEHRQSSLVSVIKYADELMAQSLN